MKTIHAVTGCILLFGTVSCERDTIDTSGFPEATGIAAEIDGSEVMEWVYRICDAHASDRKVDHTGFNPDDLFPANQLSRDSAVVLVMQAFTAMGYTPAIITLGEGPQMAYNVMAEWPGAVHPGRVILLASHLDAFHAGADDNTSAVAAMLEVARVMTAHQFKYTIRFIAFDLEEFGAIGSTRYVNAGYADDVEAAIVMDMIGFAAYTPGSQDDVVGVDVPDVGDFLFAIGNANSIEMTQQFVRMSHDGNLAKIQGILAPGDAGYFLSSAFMRSDHGLMWHNGIPAIFLTDGANFRNPHYHKASDTPETLDPVFLVNNTKAIAALTALLAQPLP